MLGAERCSDRARVIYICIGNRGCHIVLDSCSPSHNGGKNIVLRTLERLLRKAKPGLRLNEHIDELGDINRRLAVLARRSNRALR